MFRPFFLSHIFKTYELKYSVHPDVTDRVWRPAALGAQDVGKVLEALFDWGGVIDSFGIVFWPCIPAVFVGPYTGEREREV
jgi:hypothetical protein